MRSFITCPLWHTNVSIYGISKLGSLRTGLVQLVTDQLRHEHRNQIPETGYSNFPVGGVSFVYLWEFIRLNGPRLIAPYEEWRSFYQAGKGFLVVEGKVDGGALSSPAASVSPTSPGSVWERVSEYTANNALACLHACDNVD